MKKSVVQTLVEGGVTFGQVSDPRDLMKAQDFVHDRVSGILYDFINRLRPAEVSGFAYSLGAGTAFNISVQTPGRVHSQAGLTYDLESGATLNIAPADATLPRLDLVVATLDDAVDATISPIPFVRLRTSGEFSTGVGPYPPTNKSAATESHWRAVPTIKTGTPASIPTPPTHASNEIPLYLITVAPGATSIRDADVLDLREAVLTLRQLNDLVGQDRVDLANLTRRVAQLERLANSPIDLSQIFGEIRTLGDILGLLQRQIDSLQQLPEIRYANAKVALTNPASSKVPSTGTVISTIPTVQMEIGAKVFFGNVEVPILPQNFRDGSLNARFGQASGGAANETFSTDLVIANVTQIAADGFTDFVQRSAVMPAARSRSAAAARDGRYVEVFGGLAANNTSLLSDWYTYDTVADTLTQRTPSISFPSMERPCAVPYGDGNNVLVIAGSETDSTPRVFKVNATTAVVTELSGTLPTGIQFFGDRISATKIFVVAIRKEITGPETDFWEFNTTTGVFTQLGVTGNVPVLAIDYAAGCYYDQDKFVLVASTPGVSSSGRTYIFDRTTLQWTQLSIASPYAGTPDVQLPIARFRMANVNGRALLIGSVLAKDTDRTKAKVWELTPSAMVGGLLWQSTKWTSWDATFAPVQDPGFCSLIGGLGFATGGSFFFAGNGEFSDAKTRIYSSKQGGVIATTFNGAEAITIADASTFAQFLLDPHTASWDVAGFLLSLVGSWNSSNLLVEASFDNGGHWHIVKPEETYLPTDSDATGKRLLRITMYNLKTSKPVLAKAVEIFDQDGVELETRTVIYYNAPTTTKALYLNRDGSIELSDTIEPSTPARCLIHKVTPNGSAAPTLKNYINRRGHIKYSGSKGALPTTVQFDNELAVPVKFVDARAYGGDSMLFFLPSPTVTFDAVVTAASGLADGDVWIVELGS